MIRKIFIPILILLMGIGITAAASSGKHKIKFHNQSMEIVTYAMYQIDHKVDYPKPIAFVMGTLGPNKYWSVNREAGGLYYVEWKSAKTNQVLLKTEPFKLDKDMSFVVGNLPTNVKT